jgi:hypothetical protein
VYCWLQYLLSHRHASKDTIASLKVSPLGLLLDLLDLVPDVPWRSYLLSRSLSFYLSLSLFFFLTPGPRSREGQQQQQAKKNYPDFSGAPVVCSARREIAAHATLINTWRCV